MLGGSGHAPPGKHGKNGAILKMKLLSGDLRRIVFDVD